MQPNRRNQMFLEAAISRSLLRPISKLENFSLSICTAAVVPRIQNCCSFCSDQGWTSPLPIKGIPQPIPDAEELFYFKPVNETPNTDENGKPRAPDDFQPRANIKRLVSEGTLSCKEEVEQFSKKFAVEQDLVQAYIAHLQDLKIQSNIRASGRIEQKNKRAQKNS